MKEINGQDHASSKDENCGPERQPHHFIYDSLDKDKTRAQTKVRDQGINLEVVTTLRNYV